MKKYILATIYCLALSLLSYSQTYSVNWGEEIKLKKGSMDFEVINADETGVYVLEDRLKMKSYFVIGATYGSSSRLFKFDRNFSEIYEKSYDKFLKGLSFNSIQFLGKEMYLFASDYKKKDRTFTLFGARLDRKTGEPLGELQQLAGFTLESKKDRFEYKFSPTNDSLNWMLVSDVSTKERSSVSVTIFDPKLKKKSNTVINLSYEPKSFTLEDVILTGDDKILLVGRQFEEVQTGKRKTTRTFKQYVVSRYNKNGKKELDLSSDVGNHYTMNGKVMLSPSGELTMAGFYSNDPKKKEVNGVFIYKIDILSGQVQQSSFKELSGSMLDQAEADTNDEDTRKKSGGKKDEEGGISKNFLIRGVEYTSDGSLLLIAELSKYQEFSRTIYNSSTKSWEYSIRCVFTNSDLLVIKANKNGSIEWINTLPKKQVEFINSSSSNYDRSGIVSFFASGGGMPFHSSFSYMIRDNKLLFLVNDHSRNSGVKKLGDRVSEITNFRKSVAYGVILDLETGQFTRKVILDNEDDPILMPRFAFVVGKEFFLPALKVRGLAKSDFRVGKIAVDKL